MAHARIFPDPEQGKRNDLDSTSSLKEEENKEFSEKSLSYARTVIRCAPATVQPH